MKTTIAFLLLVVLTSCKKEPTAPENPTPEPPPIVVSNVLWEQTNGPYGGHITALAVNGSNLFAGTMRGGVFLSTNNGTSWTSTGLTGRPVLSLAVLGTNLFTGADNGVHLSTNTAQAGPLSTEALRSVRTICTPFHLLCQARISSQESIGLVLAWAHGVASFGGRYSRDLFVETKKMILVR